MKDAAVKLLSILYPFLRADVNIMNSKEREVEYKCVRYISAYCSGMKKDLKLPASNTQGMIRGNCSTSQRGSPGK